MPFSLPLLCVLSAAQNSSMGSCGCLNSGPAQRSWGPSWGLWSAVSSADTCAAQKKALYEMLMPQSLTGRGLNTQTVNWILLARQEGGRHHWPRATSPVGVGWGVIVIQPHQARSPSRSVASVLSSSRSPLLEDVLLAKLLTNFQPRSNLTFSVIFGWLCWSFVAAWGFSSCDV